MSDEDRRKAEREARALNDTATLNRVERDHNRHGTGIMGFLKSFIGQVIFIEGIRINYRGVLVEVLEHADGRPAGMILEKGQRVSYFQRTGPQDDYTFTHVGRILIPYEVCHEFGGDGFTDCPEWPKGPSTK